MCVCLSVCLCVGVCPHVCTGVCVEGVKEEKSEKHMKSVSVSDKLTSAFIFLSDLGEFNSTEFGLLS